LRGVVYYPPIPDETPLRFDQFMTTYKGLQITRSSEYNLYFLVAPGKIIPAPISAMFTKLTLLYAAIDDYISKHGECILADIPVPQPRRIHRKKTEEYKETGDNDFNT
jgi:hypothetical protein